MRGTAARINAYGGRGRYGKRKSSRFENEEHMHSCISNVAKRRLYLPKLPNSQTILENHFEISAITLSKVSEVNPNPVPTLASSINFSSLSSGAIMAKIGWIPKM